MSTSSQTGMTVQDMLNIESAFRQHMDDIVESANNITGNNITLCGRSAAQNLYQVMNQYKSIEATVFWMEYQVNRKLFPAQLMSEIVKALRNTTIVDKIVEDLGITRESIKQEIKVRYAVQLMAFVSRYIRIRTTKS